VNKSNLTTDGVIVVGDATTGTNSSPNSVLAATTLSIKNASITSGKLADKAVTTLKLDDKAVTVGKIADGGVNQVLTTTAAGVAQWEDKTTFAVNKSNLTTDGVIVVGDAATGTNSSPNSVLAATTLSIKNASITGGKIAANAVDGITHIKDNSIPWMKMHNGTPNSVLTASANGSLAWEPKTTFSVTKAALSGADNTIVVTGGTDAVLNAASLKVGPASISTTHLAKAFDNQVLTTDDNGFPKWEPKGNFAVTAGNGLSSTGNRIELGSFLTKTARIGTSAANQLEITGLIDANIAVDNVVMRDPSTGALKKANSAVPNFFYLPPINITITPGATNQTLNVYNIYNTQYSTPRAVSTAGTKLPVFTSAQLNYFVIYADPAVFSSISISPAGVITYSISASAKPSGATFITVVLQVK
jgi:hypothetical protein